MDGMNKRQLHSRESDAFPLPAEGQRAWKRSNTAEPPQPFGRSGESCESGLGAAALGHGAEAAALCEARKAVAAELDAVRIEVAAETFPPFDNHCT